MASSNEPANFATALANVRRLTSSGLPHQSKPAQLLVAIESTLSSTLNSTELPFSATAYFTSLQQVLEKACNDQVPSSGDEEEMAESENMGQGALIPATLYLLALVIPETSNQVILSKINILLENILPLFETSLEHPPALRSLIQIITSLLMIPSSSKLLNSSPLLKKSWNYLLELNLDPRPKVRHLAQEGIRKVLVTPIPPKLNPGSHPYLPRAREWVVSILEEETKSGGGLSANNKSNKKARFADGEDSEGKRAIWVIQGLRGWVAVWGDEQLSSLCGLLLSLPPLPHLTPQIYSLLAHLLSPPPADAAAPKPSVLTNLPTILDSLLSSPPAVSDTPTYLSAITSALIKMSLQDTISLNTYLPKAFNLIFHNILLSPSSTPSVLQSASEAIGNQGILRYCITDEAILATLTYTRQGSHLPGARKKSKTPFLYRLINSLTESMNTHALRLPYLFSILTALISRLRLRVLPGEHAKVDESGKGHTAAEELLMDLIKEVGDLRHQKGFENKDGVDNVVGMAIEVIGVPVVLERLPLNIEPDASGSAPYPGRAHLLPLIRAKTTNDQSSFFTNYFRPLSERLFEKKVSAEDGGRAAEAKVWETVVSQIWDCWSGFCEMPRDLKEGLTTPFLSLLTNLLYTQPLLLPSLLRGLSQLVSSTQRLLNSNTPSEELRKQFGLDQTSAKENMNFLKTLAKDMVSVLLNVFSKLPRESRGMVGEVIGLWVGIMTEKDIVETYNTVTTHLSTNLHTTEPPTQGASPISHTMLDLLIIFIPHLPITQSQALFNAASQGTMLEHKDATVQKKSYRALKRLLEAGKLDTKSQKLEEFVKKLSEAGGGVGPGAQRDRLQLLSALVESLPKDSLHIIPELLSEAVLGTKEVNERARDAGFDLLVIMGKKMASGGQVKVQIEEGEENMDQPSAVQANAEEYITMVAAGLTGTTPHMISASINALSRLLFEFKDDISENTLSELISTLSVFLSSKNREIVKSALGFAKVSIVSLPLSVLQPHLGQLVPALLGWVHDHKNHFKSKTIHIFERLIRRFGFDEIYNCSTELPEERKVLNGIRKRKERAKKRKNGKDDENDENADGEQKPHQSSGNAFDDILYNSDSDLSDGDSDDEEARPNQKGRKGQQQQQQQQQNKKGKQDRDNRYIRNEGDEPMDLLSRNIAGGIASSDPSMQKARRKPGQDASHFSTDKSGKLVIREDDSDNDEAGPSSSSKAMEGSGFMGRHEVDGFTRDSKGNMKFTRNTKKSRQQESELNMMIDEEGDKKLEKGNGKEKFLQERRKKRKAMGLGEEFRAKRAGGDIKKQGGPDPYSYVSLGQAGSRKQGKGGQKINLTNKKKGSRA